MRHRWWGLLFWLGTLSSGFAQVTQQVVDLPTRPGVTQRVLVLAPPGAKAAVVLFAGGHGGLQLTGEGTIRWGKGNFLVRSRQLFAEQGLTVVVLDAPSDRQSLPFLGYFLLGVCNGFQALCESGLLPGILMRNAALKFTCRFQHIRVERTDTAFAGHYGQGQAIKVCIAHGEGNYVADADTIRALEAENRVAFRYCDESGALDRPSNPNGSINAIAGIYSDKLNVLGLMPHPENLIDPLVGGIDGLPLFTSLFESRRAA